MENKILDIGGGSMHSHRPYARDSPPLVGLAGEVHLPTRIQKRVQNPYIYKYDSGNSSQPSRERQLTQKKKKQRKAIIL